MGYLNKLLKSVYCELFLVEKVSLQLETSIVCSSYQHPVLFSTHILQHIAKQLFGVVHAS